MAIADYAHEGDLIDYTPEADTDAGAVVIVGNLCGITTRPIPAGAVGALNITGVFDVDKYEGESIDLGDEVYWDADTETATKTGAYSDGPMGVCVRDAASGDAKVRVKLNTAVVLS